MQPNTAVTPLRTPLCFVFEGLWVVSMHLRHFRINCTSYSYATFFNSYAACATLTPLLGSCFPAPEETGDRWWWPGLGVYDLRRDFVALIHSRWPPNLPLPSAPLSPSSPPSHASSTSYFMVYLVKHCVSTIIDIIMRWLPPFVK